MSEIFKIFLSLSFSGSLLILALLILTPLFKDKLSKGWQYYIWLVVIVRLLLPFTTEINPVGTLFQEADRMLSQGESLHSQKTAYEPQSANFSAMENHPKDGETPANKILSANRVLRALLQNLWLVWLVMALIMLIRKITIYQSFVKYIRAGSSAVSNTVRLDRLAVIGEQAGIKKPVELYTNSLISSPMLLGFFSPCIVLPAVDLPDSDFQYTILHELTHYKGRDMFYKWLVQFTICLHWFNPLVHLMGRQINQSCELACDEAVIKKLDTKGRRSYGDTLLNAIVVQDGYKDSITTVTLCESKELMKERLEAIMKYRRKSKLIVAVSFMMTIILAVGAASVGAYSMPTVNNSIAAADLTKSNIIREGGVFFIFCDGADISDKPISTIVEGSYGFVLVRKDGYISIGPFDNINKLVDEVTKQCEYMLNKQSIVQDEAKLIVDVASRIQSGNDVEFVDYKEEISCDEEYMTWGVEKNDGAYYYNNERLRIFMDLRANSSFVNFNYDGSGTLDLKLIRNQDGDIIRAEYIIKAEADEILSDLETVHTDIIEDDVSRLFKEMAPTQVQNVINSFDTGKWYVIVSNEYQYIYYDSIPHNYAWRPEIDKDSANIDILDIGRSDGTYVLLKIPQNLKLTIYYNNKQITYEIVDV